MPIPTSLYTFAGSTAAVRQIVRHSSASDQYSALAAADMLCAVSTSLLDAVAQSVSQEALTMTVDEEFRTLVRALSVLLTSSLRNSLLASLVVVNDSYVAAATALTGSFSGDLYFGLDPALWGCSIGDPGPEI